MKALSAAWLNILIYFIYLLFLTTQCHDDRYGNLNTVIVCEGRGGRVIFLHAVLLQHSFLPFHLDTETHTHTPPALHLASEAAIACSQQLAVLSQERRCVGEINPDGPTISCLPRRPYHHQPCAAASLHLNSITHHCRNTDTHRQTTHLWQCLTDLVPHHESRRCCQPSWQLWLWHPRCHSW